MYMNAKDVKQYLRLELIKSYKNKLKYADWHNIVRSIIKRRIKDYKKRLNKVPLFQVAFNRPDMTDKEISDYLENYLFQSIGSEDITLKCDLVDYLQYIWDKMCRNRHLFSEEECHYINFLYDVYEQVDGYTHADFDNTSLHMMILNGLNIKDEVDIKQFNRSIRSIKKKIKGLLDEDRVV